MLKVVVFDSGFGGELFADYFEEEMPVVEIIRVIDWRNAMGYLKGPRVARRLVKEAIRPYVGRVDLIVFANQLIGITSLKYFRRKYRGQKFIGFEIKKPDSFLPRKVLVLTTRAVANTMRYRMFIFRLKREVRTILVDEWLGKIDDGELEVGEIADTIRLAMRNYKPEEVILAASQLSDIKKELREVLGNNIKIYDSFQDTLRIACKALKIRGGTGRKRKN